ncbi:MAG: thiamine phosphate synthase [Chloroflexi bacterium]|nr:thiamine phosphate synthase [Chloroflexota bacterium]
MSDRARGIRGLYVILDPAFVFGQPLVDVAAAALMGGARVIQWRDKGRDKGNQLGEAATVRQLCTTAGALFIVNDHADLALALAADGVHVGQTDLPVAVLRRLLPPSMLIGCSAATVEEARRAVEHGADYLGVGAVFRTASKVNTRPAGPETIREIRAAVGVPIVAIGGITPENVRLVVEAGADAAAVISAVVSAPDVRAAAAAMVRAMEQPC